MSSAAQCTRFRHRRLVAALSIMPGLLCATTSCTQPGAERYAYDVQLDFRGTSLPAEMVITSTGLDRFMHLEPEGLRITLPQDRHDLAPVVLGTRFGLQGDFDIAATLEILAADQPSDGYGAGAALFINRADRHQAGATLARLRRPNEKEVVLWDQTFGKSAERPFDADTRPCSYKRLQLRLKRTGRQLSYLLRPSVQGENFQELPAKTIGDDDIAQVVLIVTTGKQPIGVDVRWLDLRIRSAGMRGPMVPPPVASPSRVWRRAYLPVALGLLILLAAAVYLHRRRRTPRESRFACIFTPKGLHHDVTPSE